MTVLEYLEPATLTEAVSLLGGNRDTAKVLAGGSALVLLMKQKLIHPSTLISLEHINETRGISTDTVGRLHIGAMTTLTQVACDEQVRLGWPLLAEACAAAGNARLRNQATLGGNCAEADYASDPPAALVALDASIRIIGPEGSRLLELAQFFLGFYTTALAADEILTEIIIPALPLKTSSVYIKYQSRSAIDRPCVGVAAVLAAEGGVCSLAQIAVGAVCDVPQRFPNLEKELIGQRLTQEVATGFAGVYAAALESPLDDLRGSSSYRREMTRVHIKRALYSLAGLESDS